MREKRDALQVSEPPHPASQYSHITTAKRMGVVPNRRDCGMGAVGDSNVEKMMNLHRRCTHTASCKGKDKQGSIGIGSISRPPGDIGLTGEIPWTMGQLADPTASKLLRLRLGAP